MAIDAWLSERLSRSVWSRYLVAVAATAFALLVHQELIVVLGAYVPYVTLFPAIAFAAQYCGPGPSILGTLLAVTGAKYWFVPPAHSFRVLPAEFVGLATFLIAAGVVVIIGEARLSRDEKLQSAQGELEQRVKERTAELGNANQVLRELSARLLQLRDDERRRIARELHDSVGQTLAALAMNLSAAQADIEGLRKTAATLADSEALVQDMSKEVRTISYLLHPPLLDESGLGSALRWYINGFAERSNIKVDFSFPKDFGRLPRELETAIFRVIQECLTNIHRHSGSPTAKVRISHSDTKVRVEVEDNGKGMTSEKQIELASAGTPGVGIRGMRERLRQLGGRLEINSDDRGTVVLAELPITNASSASAA